MVQVKSVKIYTFIDDEDGTFELFWLNGQLLNHTSVEYMVSACNELCNKYFSSTTLFKRIKIKNKTKNEILDQCKVLLRDYVKKITKNGTSNLKNYAISQCHCDLCVNELPIIIQQKGFKYPKNDEDWFDYLRVLYFCIVKQQKHVVDFKEPKHGETKFDTSSDESSDDDYDQSDNEYELKFHSNNFKISSPLSVHDSLNENTSNNEEGEQDENSNLTRYQEGGPNNYYVYSKDLFEFFYVHRKLLDIEMIFDDYSTLDIKRMIISCLNRWPNVFKKSSLNGYWTLVDPKDDPWYDIDIPSEEEKVNGKNICGAPTSRGKCQRVGNCPSHPRVFNTQASTSTTNTVYDEFNLPSSDESEEDEDEQMGEEEEDEEEEDGDNSYEKDDYYLDGEDSDSFDFDEQYGYGIGLVSDEEMNKSYNKSKKKTTSKASSKSKSKVSKSKSISKSTSKTASKAISKSTSKSKKISKPTSKSISKPNSKTRSSNTATVTSKTKSSNSINNKSNGSNSNSKNSSSGNNNRVNNNNRIKSNRSNSDMNLNQESLKKLKFSIDENEEKVEKEILEKSISNGLCKNFSPLKIEKEVLANYSFSAILEQAGLVPHQEKLPREYVRFMILKISDNDHLPQISLDNITLYPPPLINKLWLTHISNTKDYKNFCSMLGSEIAVSCNPQTLFEPKEVLKVKYTKLKELYVYSFGKFKFYSNKGVEEYFDSCFNNVKDIWVDTSQL